MNKYLKMDKMSSFLKVIDNLRSLLTFDGDSRILFSSSLALLSRLLGAEIAGPPAIYHPPLGLPSCLCPLSALCSFLRTELTGFASRSLSLQPQLRTTMNFLIDWGLNAIDTIFSTKSVGATDANCPPQTYPAGYMMDSYGKWQPLCLSLLSVEDSEDLYIFGLTMGGFLLLGTVGVLAYREIRKMVAVQPGQPRMPVMIMEIGRHVQEQTRKLDFIAARPAQPAR